MPMPPYPVLCTTEGCGRPAIYKIAAHWSDGVIGELKTYAMACPACVADWYRKSRMKQAACRLTPGEKLDAPGIFTLQRGRRDSEIQRLIDLEERLLAEEHVVG